MKFNLIVTVLSGLIFGIFLMLVFELSKETMLIMSLIVMGFVATWLEILDLKRGLLKNDKKNKK